MHGDSDPLVPSGQSELLQQALRAHNVKSTLTIIQGAGHGFQAREPTAAVVEFFSQELHSQPFK